MDNLILTIRLHDPLEKQSAERSTAWQIVEVPREDLKLPKSEFVEKYLTPALAQCLAQMKII